MNTKPLISILIGACIIGCGDDDDNNPNPDPVMIQQPLTYTFASRFQDGQSSVAYSGQTKRNLLIESIKKYIGGLTDQTFQNPTEGDVVDALTFFYDFKNAGATDQTAIGFLTGTTPPLQTEWGELGSLASLKEKFPEFDANFTGTVIGYDDGSMTPETALLDMFTKLEGLIIARANGTIPQDPSGADISAPYVSAEGVDYQQLIQKYLSGTIQISQGTDDYLDDDIEGKGLLSDNDAAASERPYTALEHVWDEGFGYFGAARNYGDYTDEEISAKGGREAWQGANDADNDGSINLLSEYNFGHSVNASKRDLGSVVATDFSKDAFDAFLAGRTLIVNAGADLTAAQLAELQGYRDTAVGAWEKAVAATAVHYVNEVLQDMNDFGTAEYDFLAHAKHWSELKGFALALQFNVNHSPMTTSDMTQLQGYIGARPVLPSDDATAQTDYRAALISARDLLGNVYQFAADNLGDMNGENGW
ncbi:MAG: DUF4856 domain-containing protein [Myxococcota bacterium]